MFPGCQSGASFLLHLDMFARKFQLFGILYIRLGWSIENLDSSVISTMHRKNNLLCERAQAYKHSHLLYFSLAFVLHSPRHERSFVCFVCVFAFYTFRLFFFLNKPIDFRAVVFASWLSTCRLLLTISSHSLFLSPFQISKTTDTHETSVYSFSINCMIDK